MRNALQTLPIILVALGLISSCHVLLKKFVTRHFSGEGSATIGAANLPNIVLSWELIVGIAAGAGGLVCWLWALSRYDMSKSVVLFSTSYFILSTAFGILLLHETKSWLNL